MGRVAEKKRGTPSAGQFVYSTDESRGSLTGQEVIVLVPFKTLIVLPFAYPFTAATQIREVLRLKVRALLGDRVSDLFLVPLTTDKKGKNSRGAAFLLTSGESGDLEKSLSGERHIFWPVPLAFVSEVNGSGLIIWADQQQLCSLWVEDWIPQLYRWVPRSEGDIDAERALFESYAKSMGRDIEQLLIREESDDSKEDLQKIAGNTLAGCPHYKGLDLSSKGADTAEQRERILSGIMRMARALVAAGFFFAAISGGVWAQRLSLEDFVSEAPSIVYASAFGEKSRDPIRASREKLSSVRQEEGAHDFSALLRVVLSPWKDLPQGDLQLDSLRYSSEKTELQGTAKSTNSIQLLREAIEKKKLDVKAGDILQIPGGGFRFSLSIQEAKR